MFSACSLLCFCIVLHVGASLPASLTQGPDSYGTILGDGFDVNILNLISQKGAVNVDDPVFNFSMQSLPHLVQLQAIFNADNIPQGIAISGKEFYGKLALFVAGGLMNGAEIGSNIIKNGIGVGGAGLKELGGGLGGASTESAAAAQRILHFLNALHANLLSEMGSAGNAITLMIEDGTAIMENGVVTFTSEEGENAYKATQAYLEELRGIDMLMTDLSRTLRNKASLHPHESSMTKSFSSVLGGITTGGNLA